MKKQKIYKAKDTISFRLTKDIDAYTLFQINKASLEGKLSNHINAALKYYAALLTNVTPVLIEEEKEEQTGGKGFCDIAPDNVEEKRPGQLHYGPNFFINYQEDDEDQQLSNETNKSTLKRSLFASSRNIKIDT